MPHTAARLNSGVAAFVEDFGVLIGESGLPPSVGRVLGLLLVCVPEQQPAEALQLQLRLSTGSVSTALTLLQRLGLVQRISVSGERKLYYCLDPDCWQKLVKARAQQMQRGAQVAEQGLALQPADSRLLAMRDFYAKLIILLRQL